MKIITGSLRNSTAVIVGMVLTILFGYLAFTTIPIQLNPTTESPVITVETIYPGAAATEVEQEVTRRQEEMLAAVENLRELRSTSEEGRSSIRLKFDWGVNKDLRGLDVLKKLNLVEDLPEDAEEPQIIFVDFREEETIMWLYLEEFDGLSVNEMWRIADELILPQLERVTGVSRVRAFGGNEREIQIRVDPEALAARQLTLSEINQVIARENRNIRGGDIERGGTRLIVRTPAQFTNLEQIRQTVVAYSEAGPIRLGQVAEVSDTFEEADARVRVNGKPTLAMGVVKQTGENTLKVATDVKERIARLNNELEPRGLMIREAYDASEYIWDSINQVRDSLIIGAILATAILWFFLRSVASTLILGIMIPVCMVGTFVLLAFSGRSVNVISLAGLGFAGGMIVDNGIVVIENIYRHRTELGKTILMAARDGATEVWAPIVASTLTTLAVFIPILFIQEEAGQLFRDIAYAIAYAVALSMIAAITVVPMFASRWLGSLKAGKTRPEDNIDLASIGMTAPRNMPHDPPSNPETGRPDEGRAEEEKTRRGFHPALAVHRWLDPLFGRLGNVVKNGFLWLVGVGMRSLVARLVIIAIILAGFVLSLKMVPPANYLPTGNQNFVFGMLFLPAGTSLDGAQRIIEPLEQKVDSIPEVERFFSVNLRNQLFLGVIVDKEVASKEKVTEIVNELNMFTMTTFPFPEVVGRIFQMPVFGGGSTGKSVSLDIRGPSFTKLEELSNQVLDEVRQIPGVTSARSSLDLANPELQIYPDRERLAELGLTATDVASVVETMLEGRVVSKYREGGKEYDIRLQAEEEAVRSPYDIAALTVSTPLGEKVKLADVASIQQRLGPLKVEHLEQDRSVTIEIAIAEEVPLENVIDQIQQGIIDPLLPTLPFEYNVQLSGSADDLARTLAALSNSFILAVLIIFLLMAALFRSFLYPFIILFSIPLAMTGAFVGISITHLGLLNRWIPPVEFNVITMLGFILLAGVVVNNAILLVDVALVQLRAGKSHGDAILEAVRQRIRPIFMTSITSVLGMMPLALGQGSGAELYNGLGMAVVGGLTLSTIFTLILIPMLLKLFFDLRDGIALRLGRPDLTELGTARRLEELDAEL